MQIHKINASSVLLQKTSRNHSTSCPTHHKENFVWPSDLEEEKGKKEVEEERHKKKEVTEEEEKEEEEKGEG